MARRLVVLVVALLLVGVVATAALMVRPDLADARDRVDAAWAPLRGPLAERYEHLRTAVGALRAGGDSDRAVTEALVTGLARWDELMTPEADDPEAEAGAANALEALARRLEANVVASERLGANEELAAALRAFDLAVVPPPDLRAYNRAARHYAGERDGVLHRIVAGVLGFGERPALRLGG